MEYNGNILEGNEQNKKKIYNNNNNNKPILLEQTKELCFIHNTFIVCKE